MVRVTNTNLNVESFHIVVKVGDSPKPDIGIPELVCASDFDAMPGTAGERVITFHLADTTQAVFDRAYQSALLALATGMKVTIARYDPTAVSIGDPDFCDHASYISLSK